MTSNSQQQRRAGEIIFREGDAAECAYIIEEGRVEVSTARDGKPFVLGELTAGEILGEIALIDEFDRTATARVLEDCRLTVITPQQIQQRSESSDPVVRSLLRILLSRYRAELKLRARAAAPVNDSLLSYYSEVLKMRFENELMRALEAGEVKVVYQTVCRLHTLSVKGFEALIRWEHLELGAIPSTDLIHLAEETDLISAVERHVFGTALEKPSRVQVRRRAPAVHVRQSFTSPHRGRGLPEPRLLRKGPRRQSTFVRSTISDATWPRGFTSVVPSRARKRWTCSPAPGRTWTSPKTVAKRRRAGRIPPDERQHR